MSTFVLAYIYAEGWAPSSFTPVYQKLKGQPGWTVLTSPAGHDVMLDDPEGLARMPAQAA